MDLHVYKSISNERKRKKPNKIVGIIIILIILLTGTAVVGILTSTGPQYQMRQTAIEENHILREEIADLKAEIEQLKEDIAEKDEYIKTLPVPETTEDEIVSTPAPSQATTPRN